MNILNLLSKCRYTISEKNAQWNVRLAIVLRAIKLPGKPLTKKLNLENDDAGRKEIGRMEFIDYGRVELKRQKQRQGIDALNKVVDGYFYHQKLNQ